MEDEWGWRKIAQSRMNVLRQYQDGWCGEKENGWKDGRMEGWKGLEEDSTIKDECATAVSRWVVWGEG